MICDQLPNTGSDSVIGLIILGLVLVIAGAVFVFATRKRRALVFAIILIVLCASTPLALPEPAFAAGSVCVEQSSSTRVTQTSTMTGLAPGIAPVPITGLVTNIGSSAVYVVSVDVAITSITPDPASAAGTCDASDYYLLNPTMLIGQTISAGQTATFTGASIGFNNKPSIQDNCQNATVHLLYTVK